MQQDMMIEKQASTLVNRYNVCEYKSRITEFTYRCKNSLRAAMEKGK